MVLGFAVAGGAAAAQSTEADISARLVGKPLLLRGFWTDDDLHFDAAGQPVQVYKTGSFTESAMDVKAVHLQGDHLSIEGQRVALFFDKSGAASRIPLKMAKLFGKGPEKIKIEIDGAGDGDYGEELDGIFAEKLAEIAPLLPAMWQPYAKSHFKLPPVKMNLSVPGPTDEHGNGLHIGGNVKPPHVLHQVDPRFSQAARQMRFSGNVEVYLWAEADGTASHVAIVRPVGMGLDEAAVGAVEQYKFVPATQNGLPVKVDLYVDVNFQIF